MPRVPLSEIAHGRSGDKGNHSNVAVIAYTDAGFEWLKANLTTRTALCAYLAEAQRSEPAEPSADARELARAYHCPKLPGG